MAVRSWGVARIDEDADDGGEDADAHDDEREGDPESGRLVDADEAEVPEDEAGHQDHAVGLEQVGRHPGAVADVVADVVSDRGGVAGVVFGDARFHLAHQVAADVGRLGENAAADTHEQGEEGARRSRSR